MGGRVDRRFGALLAALLVALACAPAARPAPGAPVEASATPSGPAAPTATAAPTAASTAAPAPLASVKVASQHVSGDVLLFVAAERGYFQQEGLDVEDVHFPNAAEMTPALATSQVDVAGIGGTAPMWNAAARGIGMKLVLDKGSYRPPGGDSNSIVVRADLYDSGRVRGLADLRGLTMALIPPGKASGNGAVLAMGLQREGMLLDDLNVQPMPFSDMVPALANGAVDGAVLGEPFLTRARSQGIVHKLIGLGEIYPGFTVSALCFTPALYANRPVAKRFVRAYVHAARDYLAALASPPSDPSREPIYQIQARSSGIDIALVRQMIPIGFSPNGLPNVDSLLYGYQFFRENGLILDPLSDSALADLWGTELVEETLNEIGRLPES